MAVEVMVDGAAAETIEPSCVRLTLYRRGFQAMLPLWAGAIPVGVAYAVAARTAGIDAGQILVMSLGVFSAAAQVTAVSLLQHGTSLPMLIATVLALNAQLPLIGVAISRQLRLSRLERVAVAWVLTDGAYGVAAAQGRLRLPVLLGAGTSMYLGWNAGTLLGLLVGSAVPNLDRLGLSFVVPLTFLAVLTPLVRSRTAGLVVLVAWLVTLAVGQHAPSGVAMLAAGLAGSAVGGWRSGGARPCPVLEHEPVDRA